MAAVAAWQWRVEGLLIRVSFGLGLLVKEIRPPVRHPLHVMAVTYMETWLAVAVPSDHAPAVSVVARILYLLHA